MRTEWRVVQHRMRALIKIEKRPPILDLAVARDEARVRVAKDRERVPSAQLAHDEVRLVAERARAALHKLPGGVLRLHPPDHRLLAQLAHEVGVERSRREPRERVEAFSQLSVATFRAREQDQSQAGIQPHAE